MGETTKGVSIRTRLLALRDPLSSDDLAQLARVLSRICELPFSDRGLLARREIASGGGLQRTCELMRRTVDRPEDLRCKVASTLASLAADSETAASLMQELRSSPWLMDSTLELFFSTSLYAQGDAAFLMGNVLSVGDDVMRGFLTDRILLRMLEVFRQQVERGSEHESAENARTFTLAFMTKALQCHPPSVLTFASHGLVDVLLFALGSGHVEILPLALRSIALVCLQCTGSTRASVAEALARHHDVLSSVASQSAGDSEFDASAVAIRNFLADYGDTP
jgi:hypothetical protein